MRYLLEVQITLLVSNTQHIVTKQQLFLSDIIEEHASDIACMHDTLGAPRIIKDGNTSEGPRVHCLPEPLQCLIDMTGENGRGHDVTGFYFGRIDSRAGEYLYDVGP
jgi:hypothetical protein